MLIFKKTKLILSRGKTVMTNFESKFVEHCLITLLCIYLYKIA